MLQLYVLCNKESVCCLPTSTTINIHTEHLLYYTILKYNRHTLDKEENIFCSFSPLATLNLAVGLMTRAPAFLILVRELISTPDSDSVSESLKYHKTYRVI